jgi:uncharacterized membrane protein
MFFIAVGILAWITALGVLWIFAASGGALTVIAAGVFAVVAMVALGCERILSVLEEIRDRRIREVITDAPTAVRVAELNPRTAGAAPL